MLIAGGGDRRQPGRGERPEERKHGACAENEERRGGGGDHQGSRGGISDPARKKREDQTGENARGEAKAEDGEKLEASVRNRPRSRVSKSWA